MKNLSWHFCGSVASFSTASANMTTTILDVAQECIDVIILLLQTQHLARLWMTGDRSIQARLIRVDRRQFREKVFGRSDTRSELVRSLIIGCASSVETTWAAIKGIPLSGHDPHGLGIRSLRFIGSYTTFGQTDGTVQLLQSVLDRLYRLEALDFGSATIYGPESLDLSTTTPHAPTRLVLPLTITSLTLTARIDRRTMSNLKDLPLTHLAVTVESKRRSDLDFLQVSKWSATITSLHLYGSCALDVDNLRRTLPVNLLKLKLGSGYSRNDISLALSTQRCLRRLSIGAFWSLRSPLPATLVRFKARRLMFPSNSVVEENVKLLPSTLTYFWFSATSLSFEETVDFMERVVPRLSVHSALKLLRTYYDMRYHAKNAPAIGASPLEQLVSSKLIAAGLSPNHLSRLSSRDLNSSTQLYTHSFSVFFDLLPTRADMAMLVPPNGMFGHAKCRAQCAGHYKSQVKCIEWGLLDRLLLTEPDVPELNDEVLRNLRVLDVRVDRTDLEVLLWRHPFPSLITITIHFSDDETTQPAMLDVLGAIWRVRAHLPRLEKVHLSGWKYASVPLSRRLKVLMAEMRLYNYPDSQNFTYRVTPPHGWNW